MPRRTARVITMLGALAVFGPAISAAHAGNLATCRAENHVRLSPSGVVRSEPGKLDCTGWLGDATKHVPGTFQFTGTYSIASCVLSIAGGRFSGTVPRLIAFMEPRIRLAGTFALDRGAHTGRGTADGEPFATTGAASFSPDSGQDCARTPVSSGILVQYLTVVDAGRQPSSSEPPREQSHETSSPPRRPAAKHRPRCGKSHRRKARKHRTQSRRADRPRCRKDA